MDFLLRLCLNMDQWLNACVAFERTVATLRGTRFDKANSRRTAKRMILILLVVVAISTIYDPLHRHLIDDQDKSEESRIWCVSSYPSWLRSVDAVINTSHFIGPFVINILSAVIIIWQTSRRKTKMRKNLAFRMILRAQLREHKHLLIAPLLIVGLSVPRLIISMVSGCLSSRGRSWLFLTGYLFSFVPPMLTFVLYVPPSKLYRDEFRNSVRVIRDKIRRPW